MTTATHSLNDPSMVHELFEMAGKEILYRIVQVSRRVLEGNKAQQMDDALARHLARALMGENPEFQPVPGWSGLPCAQALAAVDPERFEALSHTEGLDLNNPRVTMVLATTCFYQGVYDAVKQAVNEAGATQASVEAAVAGMVDRYALAAMQPVSNA